MRSHVTQINWYCENKSFILYFNLQDSFQRFHDSAVKPRGPHSLEKTSQTLYLLSTSAVDVMNMRFPYSWYCYDRDECECDRWRSFCALSWPLSHWGQGVQENDLDSQRFRGWVSGGLWGLDKITFISVFFIIIIIILRLTLTFNNTLWISCMCETIRSR